MLLSAAPLLKGKPVGWFSPTYKMLAEVWRECKKQYAPITAGKDEQEHRLEMITGGVLDMWSLDNPDSARGRKYSRVVIDEAAKVAKLEEAWTQAIRPTLADMKGTAYFLSTPKGLNYFYSLWSTAEKGGDWARFRFSTYDNPFIDKGEIDSLRAELPERVFQQEIMAEFLADGSFFQNIEGACTISTPDQPDDHAGHHVVGGLDWAMSEDYTVLTLACRNCNRVVFWDRFNQIDYTYQRGRIIDTCQRWNIAGLLPERNSIGEPNIELLDQAGLSIMRGPDDMPGFSTTATSKPMLIQKLASGLEHDKFLAPHDYADELRSYEVETMNSGHPKFGAPTGQHDDRVMSLALAWWAMTSGQWLMAGRY